MLFWWESLWQSLAFATSKERKEEDEDMEEVQNQGKGGYVAYRNIKNHSSGGNRVVIGGIVVSRAGAGVVGRER